MNAIQDAIRRWYPIVWAKAHRVLGSRAEADDVAQEALLRFWRSGQFEGEASRAWCWILRTTTYLCADRLKLRNRRRNYEAAAVGPSRTAGPDEVLEFRSELQRIAALVPVPEFEVAILYRVDGLGQSQIAEDLGISTRTVRRLLARCDRRLANLQTGDQP